MNPTDNDLPIASPSAAASLHPGTELARGALVNVISLVASNFRGIFTLLVARLLGNATLGTFALAWSTTDLLSKLGTFGMDTSATALVAAREAAGDRRGSYLVFRRALLWGLLFSVTAALLGIVWFQIIGVRIGQPPELVRAVSFMLLALPAIGLYRISNAVSRGKKVMRHDIYSKGITETLSTIAVFLVAISFGLRNSAPVVAALLGTASGGIVAFFLARSLFGKLSPDVGEPAPVSLLRFSAPIAIYGFINMLIMRMDVMLLGLVGPSLGIGIETVGIFWAAVEVSGGMRKVRQAFDPMFTPIVAGHSAIRDHRAMEETFAQVSRWILAVLLPVVGAFCLAGGLLLDIFGPGFDRGALWVGLLAVAHATNSFVGLAETVIMVERPKLNLINSAVTLVLQLAVTWFLMYQLGATGAALGMVFAYGLQGLLRYCQMKLLFRWHLPWRTLARPAAAFAIALAVALPFRFLLEGWLAETVSGLVLLLAYAGAWKLIGLEQSDATVLRQLWRGRGRRVYDPDE